MIKQKIRAMDSTSLLFFWVVSAGSGLILHISPEGRRMGQEALLFGFTKHNWSEIHTWTSFLATGLTIIHLILEWQIFAMLTRSLFRKCHS